MIDRRKFLGFAGAIIAMSMPSSSNAQAVSKQVHLRLPNDIVFGTEMSPLNIVEYASLTCPHCAAFQRDVFPKIKQDFIDKGMMRFIWREFPLDNLAVAAAMIERSQPIANRAALIELMMQSQSSWVRSSGSFDGLKLVLKQAGISSSDIDSCIRDQKSLDDVLSDRANAMKDYNIEATPTFFINEKKYVGELSYNEIKAISDKIIPQKEAGK